MRTNMTREEPITLFLFAHQDDEIGVFQKIVDERLDGRRVLCAYLTDGGFGGCSPLRRNRESLSVLSRLGVLERDIYFAGMALSIPDGRLPEFLEVAENWIREWLSGFATPSTIYVPAWEGGHQDHDALHAVLASIAEDIGFLDCVRQFPLYNGYGCVGPLFRVFFPLSLNGAIEKTAIPWKNRIQFLRYCLSYPSQAKTLIGLLPFVVLHYFISGVQILQPVTQGRFQLRPHEGKLYYEKRGYFTWEKMADCLTNWRRDKIT